MFEVKSTFTQEELVNKYNSKNSILKKIILKTLHHSFEKCIWDPIANVMLLILCEILDSVPMSVEFQHKPTKNITDSP